MALDTYGIALQVKSDLGVAQSGLNKMQGSTKDLIIKFAKVAGLATTFTAVLMTLKRELIASYQASLKFNAGLANVATLIPGQIERVNELKDSIKLLAAETGKPLDDLTNGLYQVISAFGDNADTVGRLEAVTKGAIAGMASTVDSLNLLSAVTKAYGDTSAQALTKVSDLSFLTVKLGQTTFPELASSIQQVTDSANRMGVSQEELFTGFATLTGVSGGASEVATQLRAALVALEGPSADLAKMYAELGVASGKSLIEQYGFQGALQQVLEYSDRTGVGLQALLGRVQAMSAASNLAGSQAETYAWKLDEIRQYAGATDEALFEVTDGINKQGFELGKLKSQWEVFRTEIGDKMQPAMGIVIKGASNIISGINGMRKRSEDMNDALINLVQSTANYRTVLNSLNVDINELSVTEKAFYDIRVAQASLDLQKSTNDLARSYNGIEKEIENLEKRYNKFNKTREEDLAIVNNATEEEKLAALAYYESGALITQVTTKHQKLSEAMTNLSWATEFQTQIQQKQNEKLLSLTEIAKGVIDGLIDISTIKLTNPDLYTDIMTQVEKLNLEMSNVTIAPVSTKINPQAILDSFIGFNAKQLKTQLTVYSTLIDEETERIQKILQQQGKGSSQGINSPMLDAYKQIADQLTPMITETEKEYVGEQKKSFEWQIKQLDATGELGKLNVEEAKILAEINDIVGENAELTGLVNSLFEKQRDIIKETYEQQIDDQLFAVQNENELLDIERQRDQALKNLNKEGLATEENINNINILYDSMRDKTLENTKEQLKYRLEVSEGLSEAEKIELDRQREIEETNAKYGEQVELLALINAYYDNLQVELKQNTSLYDQMEESFKNAIGEKGYAELDKFGKTIVKVGQFVQGFSMIWSSLSAAIDSYHDAQQAQMQAEIEGLQRSYDEKRKLADEQVDDIEDEHDERLDALQEMYDSDAISYEEYISRKNQIDADAEAQKQDAEKAAIQAENDLKMAQYESEKAQFEVNKKSAISNSIIAGAQGIMQAWALGPIAGAIGSAIIAAATGYQISQIQSQPAPQPPVLTPLATGGVVTSPTQALIGEGGEPEVVAPLSKAKDFGFGGGGDTFYITGNSFVGTGGLDDLIRMLDKRKTVLARGNRI